MKWHKNGKDYADDMKMQWWYNLIVHLWVLQTGYIGQILSKGVLNMKYCPYCGAVLSDGAASFCAECGKPLPVSEEDRSNKEPVPHQKEKLKPLKKKSSKPAKKKKASPKAKEISDLELPMPADDGYDGYYDDIPPSDGGKMKEGLDADLIKKIAAVTGVMLLVVGLCVAAMYLL